MPHRCHSGYLPSIRRQMSSQVLIVASNVARDPNGVLIPETIEIVPGQFVSDEAAVEGSSQNNVSTYSIVYADSPVKVSTRRSPRKVSTGLGKKAKKIRIERSSNESQSKGENSKKKAGILCSYSQCSCTDRKCIVYRTIKKPVIESWKKFIEENDTNPRVHKGIRLCQCHFRNLDKATPKDQKLKIFLNPEIVTSSDSSYHANFQNKMAKTSERLSLIEESLSKVFNEDQVKKLIDDKPFVHYSDKTIEESFQLYKACGVKGYQLLLKRGYPLPTIRTLQRMRRKKGESFDDHQEQIYTIEAIIDSET